MLCGRKELRNYAFSNKNISIFIYLERSQIFYGVRETDWWRETNSNCIYWLITSSFDHTTLCYLQGRFSSLPTRRTKPVFARELLGPLQPQFVICRLNRQLKSGTDRLRLRLRLSHGHLDISFNNIIDIRSTASAVLCGDYLIEGSIKGQFNIWSWKPCQRLQTEFVGTNKVVRRLQKLNCRVLDYLVWSTI